LRELSRLDLDSSCLPDALFSSFFWEGAFSARQRSAPPKNAPDDRGGGRTLLPFYFCSPDSKQETSPGPLGRIFCRTAMALHPPTSLCFCALLTSAFPPTSSRFVFHTSTWTALARRFLAADSLCSLCFLLQNAKQDALLPIFFWGGGCALPKARRTFFPPFFAWGGYIT
jgi:hypothetical protein